MVPLWKWLSAVSFFSLPLAQRAAQRFQQLPRLPQSTPSLPLPSLTIIIPARDEAHNLRRLLPSLKQMQYCGETEIIVVDDRSTDDTTNVVAQHGIRLLTAPPLPADWRGKTHACHLGATVANGDWLLFTDADTIHMADSAARAITVCLQRNLDGLSLFLRHETGTWGDQLVLSIAYGGLFAGLSSKTAVINGQYILLRTAVYHQAGGFAAVRDEIIEDMALADLLQKNGYRVPIFRGEKAATVRMYADSQQMWQGLTRLGAGSLKWVGNGGWLSAAFITSFMSPLVALTGAGLGKISWKWVFTTWLAVVSAAHHWSVGFGASMWAFLTPLGALFIQMAATIGLISRFIGKNIQWKGRAV